VLLSFEELGLPAELKSVLARENFNTPSPIQSVTIPNALQGNDLINLAQTGSGKTLAFILPTILHIMNQPKTRFPRTLVLAPTRELAVQIESQFALFGDWYLYHAYRKH
jgi:superfamily II DNA/RNA helicase